MLEKFLSMVHALGRDALLIDEDTDELDLTLMDAHGYVHPDKVKEVEDWLEKTADSKDDDYYPTYYFKDFSVTLTYSSSDT